MKKKIQKRQTHLALAGLLVCGVFIGQYAYAEETSDPSPIHVNQENPTIVETNQASLKEGEKTDTTSEQANTNQDVQTDFDQSGSTDTESGTAIREQTDSTAPIESVIEKEEVRSAGTPTEFETIENSPSAKRVPITKENEGIYFAYVSYIMDDRTVIHEDGSKEVAPTYMPHLLREGDTVLMAVESEKLKEGQPKDLKQYTYEYVNNQPITKIKQSGYRFSGSDDDTKVFTVGKLIPSGAYYGSVTGFRGKDSLTPNLNTEIAGAQEHYFLLKEGDQLVNFDMIPIENMSPFTFLMDSYLVGKDIKAGNHTVELRNQNNMFGIFDKNYNLIKKEQGDATGSRKVEVVLTEGQILTLDGAKLLDYPYNHFPVRIDLGVGLRNGSGSEIYRYNAKGELLSPYLYDNHGEWVAPYRYGFVLSEENSTATYVAPEIDGLKFIGFSGLESVVDNVGGKVNLANRSITLKLSDLSFKKIGNPPAIMLTAQYQPISEKRKAETKGAFIPEGPLNPSTPDTPTSPDTTPSTPDTPTSPDTTPSTPDTPTSPNITPSTPNHSISPSVVPNTIGDSSIAQTIPKKHSETDLMQKTFADSDSQVMIKGDQASLRLVDKIVVKATKPQVLEGRTYTAYDITLFDKEGKKVQPDGAITLTLPTNGQVVEGVYHINQDGYLESLNFTARDSSVDVVVTHFSVYAVVYQPQASLESDSATSTHQTYQANLVSQTPTYARVTKSHLPETGETSSPLLFLLGLTSVLTGLLSLKKREHN